MKTQLKRLLALNLAIIMLLCAALPASAGTAEAQPQSTTGNPGTYVLTIDGETHDVGTERVYGDNWIAVADCDGYGNPMFSLMLEDYSGGAISITSNKDYTGSTLPGVILRFSGRCEITGGQNTAALSANDCRSLVVMRTEGDSNDLSTLSLGGNPAISFPDGWVRLDDNEITLTSWGSGANDPAVKAQDVICNLETYRTEGRGNGVIWRITTAVPRTVTVKGNGGTNWNGTKDDLTLTCAENSRLDLANTFTQNRKYVQYFLDDNGNRYSPFLNYRNLKPGNTVLTAVWADCKFDIPAVFYGNKGDDNIEVVDGSAEWTVPVLEDYTRTYGEDTVKYTALCWENEIKGTYTQLLSGQKMPALTRPTTFHAYYTVSETGLIFCANGETFENGWVVVQPVDTYITDETLSRCQSGKKFLGWNTKPDGTGISYANGELVPASQTQFVWLYAQWEQNGPQPGKHTLTIDGETHTIGTGTVTGDGWEAYAFLNGDNAPLLVLALNDYTGGPIKISDPTDVGTANQVYALVSISGTNTVTAQSGAGITAEGYTALSIDRYSRTASLTVSGQPAVQTDGRLQIISGGITLDGGTGAAYEAQNGFVYDDRRCEANETKTGDLVTKLAMRDIAHYLVVDEQCYYLSERDPSVSGSGWRASLTKNGDGLPILCVDLNGYTGGAISFSAPYNAGETADVLAILNYTGQNKITNEAGSAVRANGYSWLTLQERANGSSLTVSGKPAVRTDNGLTLSGRNITLDGLGDRAYTAGSFGYDGSVCSVNEERQDGVIVRVTTGEPTRVTITVYSDEEKTQTVTRTVNQYSLVDLTNLFTQANKYVKYFVDENGIWYGALFNADRDLELTAFWEECKAEVPAVFYVNATNFTEVKVVDAAADGWKAPEQTGYTNEYGQTPVTYEFLCWERKTENGYTYLLSGQEQTALAAGVGYYGRYTSSTTGIVFYANGEAFPNGMAVLEDSNARQTMRRGSQSGKILTGWNTEPDGTGTSYAADGAEVPDARTSLVRLYAQWADPENSVRVRFYAGATGYEEEKWFPRGGQIELPKLGEMFGQEQPYWDMQFFRADGSGDRMNQLQSGTTIMIPADAVECRLNAYWIPTESLVIGGQRYTFTRNRTSFSGSGESGDRWTATYRTYAGYLNVWLVDYQGPEISLPASAVLTLVESSENTITAEAGKPAISCRGWLSLNTECSDGKHPTLEASAGANAPAIKADRVMAYRAPHIELIAGEGSTVFAGGTPLEVNAYACSFSGVRSGETDTVTLDPDNMPAELSSLLIDPRMYMLSVNGGGTARTPDGKTTASKRVEAGQMASYSALGFTYPGHWCIGYSPSNVVLGNDYEVSIPNGDCAIELHWTETGYDSFLAFRSDYPLADESELKQFYKDNQNTVLFENYASGFATAPDLTFAKASSCGDLLYWYTEAGKMYETDDSQQFLPNEWINAKETGIQSGTTLRAVTDGECRRIIYANGKLFADGSRYGKKVITWDWDYAISMRATDGSELLCWNTQPDGLGTTYMRGELVPGNVKKLYAQWLETGNVRVTLRGYTTSGETVRAATVGTDYVLPQPAETADGLRFTQWRCYYIDKNYQVHELGMHDADSSLRITEDMKDLYLNANWLPTGELIVDGQTYIFDETNTFFNESSWSAEFVTWQGVLCIYLHGYQGGSISVPCAAQVGVMDGENRIDGTLSCAGTLELFTSCEYGAHPSLTITAADENMPAILTRQLSLGRVPHLTLTGGKSSKVLASPDGNFGTVIDYYNVCYYGKTSSGADEIPVIEDEEGKRVGDMWQLRTEPVKCTVTVYGSGGTTANGDPSITRELEYGEYYSLGSAGFKKQHAELVGTKETGDGKFGYRSGIRPLDIVPCAKSVTIHLRWKEIGYPYIAFRGEDVLEGDGVPGNSTVVYYPNSPTLTVPKLVYQDVASSGDLLYWYTSESGAETADSHCYLPGETVQEPDDTTLYAASSWGDVLVLVATDKTFMGWNRIIRSSRCALCYAADGRVVESWNTRPDGNGTRYEVGTPIDKVAASTRVLYAQWKPAFLATAARDSITGETILTIKRSGSMIEPPENTDDQPFAESVRIMLAAYRDGRFAGMVFAEAKDGEITCRLPSGLEYRTCELKLFFLKNGKPVRAAETIQIKS